MSLDMEDLAYADAPEVAVEAGEEMAQSTESQEFLAPCRKPVYFVVKRIVDVAASLLGLAVLSPVFLAAALCIKREDGGPVFYRAKRIGLNGKEISIFKFRSMKVNADHLEDMLTPEELEEYCREFKLRVDPRITRVGHVLRKSSIDELPQLINILRGDMSLVGPRPLVSDEIQGKYTPAQQRLLLSVRPGLTGLWQVNGRSDCTYESGERQKLELRYAESCSPWMDLGILFRTVIVVVRRGGAL